MYQQLLYHPNILTLLVLDTFIDMIMITFIITHILDPIHLSTNANGCNLFIDAI